jgi:23S rRNA pseudouridine955/2504/2580 synthase
MNQRSQLTRNGPQLVTINAAHAGQRIDNYLVATLKGVPKSLIYRLLRKGQVRVNKGRIKPVYRLKSGDIVRIPPVARATPGHDSQRPPDALCQRLQQAIIYEDDTLLVLNKPSGIAVHGGSGIAFGVIETLRLLRPDNPELALVHRLDRQTSGCLLLAKRRDTLLQLHALLRQGSIDKHYDTLVAGRWRGGAHHVDKALQKQRQVSGERMVRVEAEGQAASSLFTPQRVYQQCTLLDVQIDTGRMHQIRVHAAYLGHPVAGDDKYGDASFNRLMRRFGLKRMFLHARRLEFTWPDSGRRIRVEAPLDTALAAVLKRLEQAEAEQ